MEEQQKINCHIVTESMTKDWEFKGGWLKFFNFRTNAIEQERSKRLFAKTGLNSVQVEGAFSKFVENHIGHFKNKIMGEGITEINEWSLYRALFLYFICQTKRFTKAYPSIVPRKGLTLDELFAQGEDYLNVLTQALEADLKIMSFKVPHGHALLFPETGFFQFPIDDDKSISGYSFATAVPLTPYVVMALVPHSANLERFREFHGIISGFSVGLNENASRVVIPPVVLKHNDPHKIQQSILEYREGAKRQIALIAEQSALVQQMHDFSDRMLLSV